MDLDGSDSRMAQRLAILGLGILGAVGCSMSGGSGEIRTGGADSVSAPARPGDALPGFPPSGRMVDIGGYRLHIDCGGSGNPTVVLLHGSGDFSFDWALAQPAMARFARVCSYDRAGIAWSDLGPTPRTMKQEAWELHQLLESAGAAPPYVLVGHSVGGLIARVYAKQFPGAVAGMVLVDSTHEDTTLMVQGQLVRVRDRAKARPIPSVQTMASSPPGPPAPEDLEQAELNRRLFGPPSTRPPFDRLPADVQRMRLWFRSNPKLSAAADDYWAEELQALFESRAKSEFPLGDMPLVVLIPAEKPPGPPPPGISVEEWKRVNEEKRRQKIELTLLSRNSKLIVAGKSGHHIHLDEPELVADAVRQVVDAARSGSRLTVAGAEGD